ncbi:MAG: penicillin-binding protein 2 [Negativicutes bacterium]|nr:penicillin-binding protein 2 [Negativicutes bacterium]
MWAWEKSRRMTILRGVIFAVIALLVVRLAWMQLLHGTQYKKIAEENRLRRIYEQAPRGTMYDRNGAVLVSNRPSFAVSVIPAEYTKAPEVTPILASLTGLTPGEIEAQLQVGEEYPYTPVRLIRDVNQAILAKIEEHKAELPGVLIEAIPVRYYVYGQQAAHLFGIIGRINEEEYAGRKGAGYRPSDLIGKDGLEWVWEDTLRGVDGSRESEVNALGEEVARVGEKKAIAGKGLVLTLDANLQKAAEEALDAQIVLSRQIGYPAKGGAVVVLDARTGGVRAMVSKPSFDPNVFVGGISSHDWNALIGNPDHPLNNRVIQNAYPPGSVFKIVTSAAALDLGLTNPDEIFEDRGFYLLSGWTFYGAEQTALGRLNIVDAIAKSSDPTFYELARRMGVDNLASYALTFGYGNLTGIRLPGEVKGNVPTEEWKSATYNEPWYPGETIIAGIGQGYYLATPLQQAMSLMAVANGGVVYRPMLVDKVLKPTGQIDTVLQPDILRTIYLRPEIWQIIRSGLEAVTTRGTAAAVFQGYNQKVAGKTGSAETGRGNNIHSWFACYAPADKPEIVVAALIEDAGEGAVSAAPLVRRVLEAYFGLPAKPIATPPPGKGD